VPIDMRVIMGNQSILFRTLLLFAGAAAAAIAAIALVIWVTMRRARKKMAAAP
jgi:hypothetical protein